jgi:hypothetical protein
MRAEKLRKCIGRHAYWWRKTTKPVEDTKVEEIVSRGLFCKFGKELGIYFATWT